MAKSQQDIKNIYKKSFQEPIAYKDGCRSGRALYRVHGPKRTHARPTLHRVGLCQTRLESLKQVPKVVMPEPNFAKFAFSKIKNATRAQPIAHNFVFVLGWAFLCRFSARSTTIFSHDI